MTQMNLWKWIVIVYSIFAITSCNQYEDIELGYHLNWEEIKQEAITHLAGKERCFDENHNFECSTKSKYGPGTNRWNRNSVCDCGSNCMEYGGCCLDKAKEEWTNGVIPNDKYKCSYLNNEKRYSTSEPGMLMVSKCDSNYTGSSLEPLCLQKDSIGGHDIRSNVPVISLTTSIAYVNYYCALCNDDAELLLNHSLKMECNHDNPVEVSANTSDNNSFENFNVEKFLSTATYVPQIAMWIQMNASEYNDVRCWYSNVEYHGIEEVRPFIENCTFPTSGCKKNNCPREVTECLENWSNQEDIVKCQSYTTRVFDWKQKLAYKNPHCALCNGVNLSSPDLRCYRYPSFQTRVLFKEAIPSFRNLFVISSSPWEKCSTSQIYSFTTQKCEDFLCGKKFIKRRGKCIPKYKHIGNSTQKFVNICPKIYVFYNQSQIDENGTFSLGKEFFDVNDYRILNETTLLLCDNRTRWNYMGRGSNVTLVVFVISEFCLLCHIILFFKSSHPRSCHKMNLTSLCVSLFVAQFLFLVGVHFNTRYGFCFVISVLLHFFWLASFFWMNILSVDIYKTFSGKKHSRLFCRMRSFNIYMLYAWGFPFIIVSIATIVDLATMLVSVKPNYALGDGINLCWITNGTALLLFFLVPITVIILENCILFVLTSINLCKQMKETRFAYDTSQSMRRRDNEMPGDAKNQNRKKNTIRFALYSKLGLLQGVTWASGFAAYFIHSQVVWDIFTIITGLQGAFIFIFFDLTQICKKSKWKNIVSSSVELLTGSNATRSSNITNS